MDILRALGHLRAVRPIFHSEADFQHAFAWQLQQQNPESSIRLEVPLYGLAGRGALDIALRDGNTTVALELKYGKAKLESELHGEEFRLSSADALDEIRYGYCKDIARLEHAISSGQAQTGFAILLTNASRSWRTADRQNICHDFRLDEQRHLTGELIWQSGSLTVNNHPPIKIKGCYPLSWQPYSDLGTKNGEFRVLVVEVT